MKRYRLFPQLAGILLCLTLSVSGVCIAEIPLEHKINVNIPEILHLEVEENSLIFDLHSPNSGEQFPASSYPAYYTPTSSNKYITVGVFSNMKKEWRLMIRGETNRNLRPQAVEWSLNRETWFPLQKIDQMIKIGSFTGGWEEIKVYFRLVMFGDEDNSDGEYKVQVHYNLSSV